MRISFHNSIEIVFKRKYLNGKFSLFTFTIVFAFYKWKMHMAENVFGNKGL